MSEHGYRWLADAVLAVHFGIVAFVVGALLLVVVGNLLRWRWVNGWWFRVVHLVAIGVVVMQAWLGVACPLTTLEIWLREQAQQPAYEGSFVQHWVERWLYHDAPLWVFTLAYSLFGLVVALAWRCFPPRRRGA